MDEGGVDRYLRILMEKMATAREALRRRGDLSLSGYLSEITSDIPHPLQDPADLCEAVRALGAPIWGDAVAEIAARSLREHPVALTANHIGVEHFAQSLQSALLLILGKTPDGRRMPVAPVFSFGNIPMNNLTYPRGILLYQAAVDRPEDLPLKLPLFPGRFNRSMACRVPPYDAAMAARLEERAARLEREGVLGPGMARCVSDLVRRDYRSRPALAAPDFATQAAIVNRRIWARLFAERPPSELAYLQMETLAARLLETDLLNPSSLASSLLFDPALREKAMVHLDGVQGCWDLGRLSAPADVDGRRPENAVVPGRAGTFFFWAVDRYGRRIPLRPASGRPLGFGDSGGPDRPDVLSPDVSQPKASPSQMMLPMESWSMDDQPTDASASAGDPRLIGRDDRGESFSLPLTPASVRTALADGRIIPSLFTCFLTVALARGVVCLGGYYQSVYLSAMKAGVMKALKSTKGYGDAADALAPARADGYLSGILTVMTRRPGIGLLPAGPVEIIAAGGLSEADLERMAALSLLDAHRAGLLDTIVDILPEAERPENWVTNLCAELERMLADKVVIKNPPD